MLCEAVDHRTLCFPKTNTRTSWLAPLPYYLSPFSFLEAVNMSVNMPNLCDLLSTALDPARLTAAALVSTKGAVIVSASRSPKSKDRTAIIMVSLATAMWEEAATPGEKTDEVRANESHGCEPRLTVLCICSGWETYTWCRFRVDRSESESPRSQSRSSFSF